MPSNFAGDHSGEMLFGAFGLMIEGEMFRAQAGTGGKVLVKLAIAPQPEDGIGKMHGIVLGDEEAAIADDFFRAAALPAADDWFAVAHGLEIGQAKRFVARG